MRKASLATMVLLTVALPLVAQDTVTEEESGVEFAAQIEGAGSARLTCTGVSCREKTWLAVNVYAIAQYADAKALAKSLAAWKGKAASDLIEDQAFFDAMSAADCEKRLKLQFVYDVDAETIRESFQASLVTALGGTMTPNADTFIAWFQQAVEDGSDIEIRSLPGGSIQGYQNGTLLGSIERDRGLATAVWKIWFQTELADDYLLTVKQQLIGRIAEIWK